MNQVNENLMFEKIKLIFVNVNVDICNYFAKHLSIEQKENKIYYNLYEKNIIK